MNPDGKRSEKVEAEDSLRTVECLRGRLLAERVASRNAKEEVERMENKLIEMEKKLIEEYNLKNRAEKKLKFLMKKLQSMNIPFVSYESEQSGSCSVARSEISSIESSATSQSTKEVDEKENNVNSANSSIDGNRDNPAAGRTNCSSDGVNSPQLTIQKEEIEEFKEKKFESPRASNNCEQNACSFAKNQDNPASQNVVEKSESSSVSNNSEQNACSFDRNQDNPESQKMVGMFESSSVSNNSEQNSCLSPEYHDASVAGEGTSGYSKYVNSLELTMKIQTESPIDLIKCEQDACGSCKEDHETPAATATETISSINRIDFPELAMKEDKINESKVKNEFPSLSIKPELNACTNNQLHGSSGTPQEIYSHHKEPQCSQKPKKHDRSLRTLLKKEKLDEENGGEHDDEVDNSLALVPVDLPMPMPKPKQQSVDPVILDATVKEVLGSLRNAKDKLQRSMERRRSNMIKVG